MSEYTNTNSSTTISLPPELDHRLDDFARQEGTSKSALILQAIEKYLEDLEDISEAEQVLTKIEQGNIQILSLEEMERRLALGN